MRKKSMKKVWAGLLTAAMAAGLCLQAEFGRSATVYAAEGASVKTMNLDLSVLKPSGGTWDTSDCKVYFGAYNSDETLYATLFRILDIDTETMLLDCDTILWTMSFSTNMSNSWTESNVRKNLNNNYYYSSATSFTSVEQSAIAETSFTASGNKYTINDSESKYMDYADTIHIYLLSAEEACELYQDEASRKKMMNGIAYRSWLLRSAVADKTKANSNLLLVGAIDADGKFNDTDTDYGFNGVSPAFRINRSAVLFASACELDKKKTLTAVEASNSKTWKLTLFDNSKAVKITGSVTKKTEDNRNIISVSDYQWEGSGVTQISVMITDKAYDTDGAGILYYGKLTFVSEGEASGSGNLTIELPDDLPDEYMVYLLAEDVNDSKHTDYASAPVVVTAETSAANPEFTYTITEGANLSIAEDYDGTITVTADGECSKFVSVSVDGTVVDAANYTVESGSTIVTFTKAYVNTLSVGTHTVRLTYTDGYAETTLTITKQVAQSEENAAADAAGGTTENTDTTNAGGTADTAQQQENGAESPQTGDDAPIFWLLVLMSSSGAALCFVLTAFLERKRSETEGKL